MNEKVYRNPSLATDAIVVRYNLNRLQILLIKRKNPPYGWALPGGFVDYGEATDIACIRELKEETNLDADRVRLFKVASDPDRDPRQHVVSIVYLAHVKDNSVAEARDDATELKWFNMVDLPELAFDHLDIITEFMEWEHRHS